MIYQEYYNVLSKKGNIFIKTYKPPKKLCIGNINLPFKYGKINILFKKIV